MIIKEENFIEQLKCKNEKALLYVIDQYGGLIRAVIKKNMHYLESCQEECMNDVLLGIWENIIYYDSSKSSFKNWAAGIARYKSIDYLRKYLKESENESLEGITAGKEDAQLRMLVEQEISEELEDMLDCLKPRDRDLFLRLYGYGQDLDEVSESTGLKREVIYNRMSRAKKKIRSLFTGEKGADLI